MMHRSALLGTAGLLVLAVLSHVVISGLLPQREVAAEEKQSVIHEMFSPKPSRFTSPDNRIPMQPMPSRMDAAPSTSQFYSQTRLISGESSRRQSSRRQSGDSATPEVSRTFVPSVTSPGLPSSLDEALSRFRENPVSVGSETQQEQSPMLEPDLEASSSTPSYENPMGTPSYQSMSRRTNPTPQQPAENPYRYHPMSEPAPSANGSASIGGMPPVEHEKSYPQPLPMGTSNSTKQNMPEPTPIPRRSISAVEVPGPSMDSTSSPTTNLLSVHSPSVIVETIGPKSLVIGKPATYRVHARNMGEGNARDVTVLMMLPQGVQLQDLRGTLGSPRQVAIGQGNFAVQWDIPVLPTRNEGFLDLILIATQKRNFELEVEVAYAPLHTKAAVSVLEPKLEMVIDGPNDILFGDSQIFKVIARNTGTGPAENVSITIMPIKKGQNPTVIDSIGTIAPGDQKVLELELTAKQAGTLSLRAETSASNGLRAEASHDVMVRRAELEIRAQGPAMKYASTTAAYAVVVANTGNANAKEIEVEAQLPTGSKFVSASHGGRHDETTGRVIWKLSELESDSEQPLQVVATLLVEGNNVLQVNANADQGLTSRHEMITRVESVADLKLQVNDPTGPIPVGQEVEYEFRLNNRGTKEARGVVLTISFGEGIEPLSIEGGKGTIQGDTVQLNTISAVNSGQDIVVKVKARGRSEGNHTFRAEVRCEDPTTRLAIEESTHFYGAIIQTATPQQPAGRFQSSPSPGASPAPLSPTPFSRYR